MFDIIMNHFDSNTYKVNVSNYTVTEKDKGKGKKREIIVDYEITHDDCVFCASLDDNQIQFINRAGCDFISLQVNKNGHKVTSVKLVAHEFKCTINVESLRKAYAQLNSGFEHLNFLRDISGVNPDSRINNYEFGVVYLKEDDLSECRLETGTPVFENFLEQWKKDVIYINGRLYKIRKIITTNKVPKKVII